MPPAPGPGRLSGNDMFTGTFAGEPTLMHDDEEE
jgi:hypothetical protein